MTKLDMKKMREEVLAKVTELLNDENTMMIDVNFERQHGGSVSSLIDGDLTTARRDSFGFNEEGEVESSSVVETIVDEDLAT
jgi:hypothetical protein